MKKLAIFAVLAAALFVIGTIVGKKTDPPAKTQISAAFPHENRQISVVIRSSGLLSPEDVEKSVTSPAEAVLSELNGLKEMLSTTRESESNIIMEFDGYADLSSAVADARKKIGAVIQYFPESMQPPVIAKFNFSDDPVVIVSLTSEVLDTGTLSEAAETAVKAKLAGITGIANIEIAGGSLAGSSYSRLNGQKAVSLFIQKEFDADRKTVQKEVLEAVELLQKEIDRDIGISLLNNDASSGVLKFAMDFPPMGSEKNRMDEYNKIAEKFEETLLNSKDHVESVISKVGRTRAFFYVQTYKDPQYLNRQVMSMGGSGYYSPAFIYFPDRDQDAREEICVELYGPDYKTLTSLAFSFAGKLQAVGGLTDVKIKARERGNTAEYYHKDKKLFVQLFASLNGINRAEAAKKIYDVLQKSDLPQGYYFKIPE